MFWLYSLFLHTKRYRNSELIVHTNFRREEGVKNPMMLNPSRPMILFCPVESGAKAQSGHKGLANQVRGSVSLFKYPKAHLQITFVVSHISSLCKLYSPD